MTPGTGEPRDSHRFGRFTDQLSVVDRGERRNHAVRRHLRARLEHGEGADPRLRPRSRRRARPSSPPVRPTPRRSRRGACLGADLGALAHHRAPLQQRVREDRHVAGQLDGGVDVDGGRVDHRHTPLPASRGSRGGGWRPRPRRGGPGRPPRRPRPARRSPPSRPCSRPGRAPPRCRPAGTRRRCGSGLRRRNAGRTTRPVAGSRRGPPPPSRSRPGPARRG